MADDTRQTLDIPNGTTFEFQDGKLVFGHESDIVIRTNLGGYKFRKIFSKHGSVHVMPPAGVEFEVDEIEADQGGITLTGAVRVHQARAKTVHCSDGKLTADRIEAEREVELAGKTIDVLHVKAPKVTIDPACTGTCLVIESNNDPGSFRATGGFRSIAEAQTAFDRFRQLEGGGKPSSTEGAAQARSAPSAPASAPAAAALRPAQASAGAATLTGGGDGKDTQEFRPPRSAPGSATEQPTPSLPKSSVFRKRK